MGVEYDLVDRDRKEFIGMGKHLESGFQMPSERIVAFIRGRGTLDMVPDTHNLPHESEDGWRCLGRWWWGEAEYRLFAEGLMSADGHGPLAAPPQ